jgi:spore coat protein CotH
MNQSRHFILGILATMVTACGNLGLTSQSDFSSGSSSSSSGVAVSSSTEALNVFADYPLVWLASTRLIFSVKIASSHLLLLNDLGQEKNGKYNDVYVPIELTVTVNDASYVLTDVGIRMKGNIFSRGPFLEQNVVVRPFHFRLRFNELFDDEAYALFGLKQAWNKLDPAFQARKNRSLFGLTSLEFKWNRSRDPSLINQVYSANQYLQHNLLAPRTSLGEVHLLDASRKYQLGIYTISEPIDERFIARHFSAEAAKGDLYKALYPVTLNPADMGIWNPQTSTFLFYPQMVGVEDTLNFYHPVYDLKTNKKTSNHESLRRLVATLASLPSFPADEQLNRLKQVVHLESFLKYAAISYLIGNPDDMRNNKNNTYIYFDSVTQLAYFIPYDLDWSLGIIWDANLPINQIDYSPFSPIGTYGVITNPLYWLTIFDRASHPFSQDYPLQIQSQLRYKLHLQTYFNDSRFSPMHFQAMMNTYQTTYGAVLTSIETNSTFLHSDPFSHHHQLISTQMLRAI